MPMRQRPGHKLVTWWLPLDLLQRLDEYRHAHRLESLTEAARRLLADGLRRWDRKPPTASGDRTGP